HKIGEPLHLFTRIDDALIQQQIDKLNATDQSNQLPVQDNTNTAPTQPMKSEITYEDFTKLDIRTATIVQAEKIEKADKLLKLTLDLGLEKRTVVSGIAEHYKPEEVVGKKVSLLANLAPRKMKGVESQGMILMAEDSNGKLSFISPDENWENGQIIK
ncbi:MAG: methionine--tRNA ligase subunit beta, partial [Saprospiraceae bacterium]